MRVLRIICDMVAVVLVAPASVCSGGGVGGLRSLACRCYPGAGCAYHRRLCFFPPAPGHRLPAGSGHALGAGVRIETPIGPLRLEYAVNDRRQTKFHIGIGSNG